MEKGATKKNEVETPKKKGNTPAPIGKYKPIPRFGGCPQC